MIENDSKFFFLCFVCFLGCFTAAGLEAPSLVPQPGYEARRHLGSKHIKCHTALVKKEKKSWLCY